MHMEGNQKVNIRSYWLFWGLNFVIHIILGVCASLAGIVIIYMQSEVVNGLALIGAGSFALINGYQGIVELRNQESHPRYKTLKESNQ